MSGAAMDDVIIVGGGIGGLTLALMLHQRGIGARVYEAAAEIKPIGVGVSLLPHASAELGQLGLIDDLAEVAVTTTESCFFNRFGQFVYSEPVGRHAGYGWPQFQIHRRRPAAGASTGPTSSGCPTAGGGWLPGIAAPAPNRTPAARPPTSPTRPPAGRCRRRGAQP